MQRLEFHISYKCLNDCIFCGERDQINRFKGRFVEREEIENRLKQFSQRGFNHITFTGGEPTYYPDFVELLRLVKELGYKTYVSSNGGFFSSKRFCRKILAYLDELCFSLHGHNAKLHNFHTRNKRSYNRLLKALENVEDTNENLFGFINIVITKYNFGFIYEIIDFISHYKKIKQILISNFAPEGNGLRNFQELAIPLIQIKESIGRIVHLSQNKSLIVKFFGIPLCILEGYEKFSNDVYWSPRATLEQWKVNKRIFLKKTLSYKPVRNRIKTNKCKSCMACEVCGGIFRRYYQEFGDRELTPF